MRLDGIPHAITPRVAVGDSLLIGRISRSEYEQAHPVLAALPGAAFPLDDFTWPPEPESRHPGAPPAADGRHPSTPRPTAQQRGGAGPRARTITRSQAEPRIHYQLPTDQPPIVLVGPDDTKREPVSATAHLRRGR